jgi:signal transduction histidine kinase
LHLMIEDNGVGMDPIQKLRKPSLGMIGMQARAKQIGGELVVSKSPLGGVRLEASALARKALVDAEQKDAHFVG